MKVAVLGTGTVGRTLAGGITATGREVALGTRDPDALATRELDGESFGAWVARTPGVSVATFADAAADAELVINATPGTVSMAVLEAAGADNLREKIVVDVANPLDFSRGMPPSLSVVNTDSLAEQIQRAFPDARVVKALNTVNARVMVNPGALGDGDHDMLICGNDLQAKAAVTVILRDWFGWATVHDIGDITAARGMEMYLPLWLHLMSSLRTPMFNVKIVV